MDGTPKDLVIDLTGVTFLSMAGAQALMTLGERLASSGHRLIVGTGTGQVRKLLDSLEAAKVLDVHPTADAAVAAYLRRSARAVDVDGGDGEARDGHGHRHGPRREDPARLREQIYRLRADLRTRPVVARAMGILQGRYRLSGGDTAFDLLRDSSQQHNLKLRSLAAAVVTTPPPANPHSEWWFPGRVHAPPPAMSFSEQARQNHDNRATVLEVVLQAGLSCMRTDHGSVHLIDPVHGGLQLEIQQGFSAELADLFAYVDGDGSACGAALRRGGRVVVDDVASDPIFAGRSGEVMLANGYRSVQSTPLVSAGGRVVGMLSTHDRHPGRHPAPAEAQQLDLIGCEAGIWLVWHQNTIVLDALEYLHQHAR